LTRADEEKGVFSASFTGILEFYWEGAYWQRDNETFSFMPIYQPPSKLMGLPLVKVTTILGTFEAYKVAEDSVSSWFHKTTGILLLRVSLSEVMTDPFTGKPSRDVTVISLIDTNVSELKLPPPTSQWLVGVKPDDWAVYEVSFKLSSDDPRFQNYYSPLMDVAMLKIVIQNASGVFVSYTENQYLRNGTVFYSRKVELNVRNWEFEEEVTVEYGKETYIRRTGRSTPTYFIAANLSRGNRIFDYIPMTFDVTERIMITDTILGNYAGVNREVNYLHCLGFYPHDPEEAVAGANLIHEGKYYWDRITGILTEAFLNSTSWNENYKTVFIEHITLKDTNIWTPLVVYHEDIAVERKIARIIIETSSASITGFSFNDEAYELSFTVNGTPGKVGFCNVTLPKELVSTSSNIKVYFDSQPIKFTTRENSTHYFIYFEYVHSAHKVIISLPRAPTPTATTTSTPTPAHIGLSTEQIILIVIVVFIVIAIIGYIALKTKKKT
jgi:hypothetical protein